jgi:ubiquitin-protein ligase E3 D
MPELYLYAELLLHIRQLTLYASLEEDKHKGTQILLSSDKKVITAIHDDETSSIYLPTQIKGTANITFPLKRRTEFSTKLQIEDQNELRQAIEASPGIQVPWTASALSATVSLHCKACFSTLVEAKTISQWKDLPSENWAELMDLWFCHKPHEHDHDTSAAAESKGFSARSRTANERGTGLIDDLSFVLQAEDCSAQQVSAASQQQSLVRFSFFVLGKKKEACYTYLVLLDRPLIQLPQIQGCRTAGWGHPP